MTLVGSAKLYASHGVEAETIFWWTTSATQARLSALYLELCQLVLPSSYMIDHLGIIESLAINCPSASN